LDKEKKEKKKKERRKVEKEEGKKEKLPKPPIRAGITKKKIMMKAWAVIITLYS